MSASWLPCMHTVQTTGMFWTSVISVIMATNAVDVILFPEELRVSHGNRKEFLCYAENNTFSSIEWLLNGSKLLLNSPYYDQVLMEVMDSGLYEYGKLEIQDTVASSPQQNNTEVQCRLTFPSNDSEEENVFKESNIGKLYVQGLFCPKPATIKFGSIPLNDTAPPGTEVPVSCDHGYTPQAYSFIYCTTNGEWSPDPVNYVCSPEPICRCEQGNDLAALGSVSSIIAIAAGIITVFIAVRKIRRKLKARYAAMKARYEEDKKKEKWDNSIDNSIDNSDDVEDIEDYTISSLAS